MQQSDSNTPQCRQCGECCRKGGPALHIEDLPLIENGTIALADIVTLRSGERAYDQPGEKVVPLESEVLKIKGRDGNWTCLFFSPESNMCGVYSTRPIECEMLFCQDTAPLSAMYDKGRLSRTDVLPEGHPLLELITEHDAKCNPVRMEALGMAAREGDTEAGKELKEMVVFDTEVRRLVTEKAGMAPELNDFLFGRPMRVLLANMNIKVYETGGTLRFGFNS
ncbi:YkgJ family cysteine cluster protein [Pseudodesulfovibrio sediminis]|uniref:Zinc/iron-chelating domain-containing protein n=1 Tax=Pseudodesulfovibrio sediminis TaxID=2810563 RepID=A0ABM7P8Y6_9BACT|nr:YkgJ family cysteine cluster protein [Pseudodesulfovibrio sediminis]BCS89497.1 zinc/iron-chelating domain-containing protein [Pseudodesulfovibrio sediminis]